MDKADYIMIGKRVKAYRLASKLTQEKLAEASGIGIQHMSKIENGSAKLSLSCFVALANALQTTADHLLMDNISALKSESVHAADSVFADCTQAEIFVLTETLNALKSSLRAKGLTDKK